MNAATDAPSFLAWYQADTKRQRALADLMNATPTDLKRLAKTLSTANYDSVNRRFAKMTDGERFRSSRGLEQNEAGLKEAQRQYLEWFQNRQQQAKKFHGLPLLQSAIHIEPDAPKAKPTDKSMEAAVKGFIEFKARKVSEGQIVILNAHLKKFWLGHTGELRFDAVTREKWESIMADIDNRTKAETWSKKYAHDVLVNIRSFYNWLYQTERIDAIPRYVTSELYTIAIPKKLPEFFTGEELAKVFKASSDDCRLWWLLCLNCSMTQSDLSDLTWEMIDLDKGTLTRRRGKHQSQTTDRIPTVVYTLWPSVLKGLQALEGRSGRVFSNEAGKPLVGANRHDCVSAKFRLIAKPLGIEKSVKHFRKTGVTLMATKYRAWRELYLANASNEVTDKNYDGTTTLPSEVTEHIRQQLPKECKA